MWLLVQSHWFTIRKMRGEWYNLNSLYAAPEHLSQVMIDSLFTALSYPSFPVLDLVPTCHVGVMTGMVWSREIDFGKLL